MASKYGRRLVIKSNSYALSQYNMSATAQKIVNLAISELSNEAIDPETANLKEQISVRLTASTIKQFLEWTGNSIYDMMDEVAAELQNIKIVIDGVDEKGRPVRERVNPFSHSKYADGYIDIYFEPFMNQHLLKTAQTTRYYLADTKGFKKKYTVRMYEICQSILYFGAKGKEFDFDDLKRMVGSKSVEYNEKTDSEEEWDKYPRPADFKRWVLKPAQEEMEKAGALCFKYKEIKTGRVVTGFWIAAEKKDEAEMTVPKPKVEHTYQEIPNGGLGDMFFYMDEIRSFTHEDFNSQEINNLLVTADYDVNKVREKYELSKKQRNQIDNLYAWMIAAIERDFQMTSVSPDHGFEERRHDEEYFNNLEKKLLQD